MKSEVESEIKQTDTDDVSRLVGELSQTEAPPNFERAVMTRVAGRAAAPRRVFGMAPALAYSLPLVLIALVGLAIFIVTRQAPSRESDLVGQRSSQFTSNETPAPAVVSPSVEQTTVASNPPTERRIEPSIESPSPPNSTKRREVTPPGGGSFDAGVNRGTVVSNTNDVPRNPNSANRDEVISSNSVPVRDILSTLGITAEYNGGWIVRRVTANSQAEHSGLKVGDAIVAVGDTVLGADTEFKGQFSASTIRVRRNGQILDLNLK